MAELDFNFDLDDIEKPETDLPGSKLADKPLDFNFLLPSNQDKMRSSIRIGSQFNPDTAAKAAGLSKSTGLPADIVERNLDEVERETKNATSLKTLENRPGTAAFLSDPENAKVAHDDIDNLASVEEMMGQITAAQRVRRTLAGI